MSLRFFSAKLLAPGSNALAHSPPVWFGNTQFPVQHQHQLSTYALVELVISTENTMYVCAYVSEYVERRSNCRGERKGRAEEDNFPQRKPSPWWILRVIVVSLWRLSPFPFFPFFFFVSVCRLRVYRQRTRPCLVHGIFLWPSLSPLSRLMWCKLRGAEGQSGRKGF